MGADLLGAPQALLDRDLRVAPTDSAISSVSLIIVETSVRVSGCLQISSIVARVSALSGLNATLPMSLTQISSRTSCSIGHFSPPSIIASLNSRQRSEIVRFGSPIVKRVPSRWRTTPGASSSVPA